MLADERKITNGRSEEGEGGGDGGRAWRVDSEREGRGEGGERRRRASDVGEEGGKVMTGRGKGVLVFWAFFGSVNSSLLFIFFLFSALYSIGGNKLNLWGERKD